VHGLRKRFPTPLPAGLTIVAVITTCALFPAWLTPYDPLAFDLTQLLRAPSLAHPFGTDNFGRDILSRTISASRLDIQIALLTTTVPLIIGSLIGLLIGFRGGILDIVFGRLVDLTLTFPFLVIVIAILSILGPGLANMYVAVGVVGWIFYARLVRSETILQKQNDYVAAAQVLGYSSSRILLRHILPNSIAPLLIYWTSDMALKILLGSSLGYLGLGAQAPDAEWGALIADGKDFFAQAWWMTFFPGAAIVFAGLGFSLTGDGLADLLDVKR
jgi:peptide/nickel transport system permease protein